MSWIGNVARGLKTVAAQPLKGIKAIGKSAEGHTDRRTKELTAVIVSEALPLVVTGVAEILEKFDADNRLTGLSDDAIAGFQKNYRLKFSGQIELERKGKTK